MAEPLPSVTAAAGRASWMGLLVSAVLLGASSLAAQAPEPDGPAMGECARDLLRTRLATAVSGDDILPALAVETELLTLCRERQELVATILENEDRLRGLLEPPAAIEPMVTQRDLLALFGSPPEAATEPPPDYGWFSILGTPGLLRAGITDGAEVWWVREGSTLPGAVVVESIAVRPPAVTVSGAASLELPWRPAPGQSGMSEP